MKLGEQGLVFNPEDQNFIGNMEGLFSSSPRDIIYPTLLVGRPSRSLSYYVALLYLLLYICNSYLAINSARLSAKHPA